MAGVCRTHCHPKITYLPSLSMLVSSASALSIEILCQAKLNNTRLSRTRVAAWWINASAGDDFHLSICHGL
jgi:hypothetical protein